MADKNEAIEKILSIIATVNSLDNMNGLSSLSDIKDDLTAIGKKANEALALLEPEEKSESTELAKEFRNAINAVNYNGYGIAKMIEKSYQAIDHLDQQAEQIKAKDKAYKALLNQISELAVENDRLKKAFMKYGTHGRSSDGIMCHKSKHSKFLCTCGLEQALKESESNGKK